MSTANYAFAFLASTPMRAEASDRSEMVNEVLFGELFEILEEQSKWIKIKLQHDGYQGWIDPQMCTRIPLEIFEEIKSSAKYFVGDDAGRIGHKQQSFPVTRGACLPGIKDGCLTIGKSEFTYSGALHESAPTREQLHNTALKYLGTPYYWGGRTSFGIDCSGFTQMVYRMNGLFLPRDASQQAKKGTTLSFLEECQPGDLAFFDNAEGAIVHVGIVLEDFRIIHASGRVRIDTLDHSGIYNNELGKHTHKLRVLKCFL